MTIRSVSTSTPRQRLSEALISSVLVRRTPTAAIDLSDAVVDWMATVRRANGDFVGPALSQAFSDLGIADALPADVRDYLQMLHTENARCNVEIRRQCDEIGSALAAVGVQGVLLKGAAWFYDAGPAVTDRMVRDIDLLVDRRRADTVRIALRERGYRDVPNLIREPGHIHEAPMATPNGLVNVEVHYELATRTSLLPAVEVLGDGRPVARGLAIPSPTHRLAHAVIHAEIVNGDYFGGTVSLRDSLDVSRLVVAYSDEINWQALVDTARARGFYPMLSGALHKASQFTGAPLPDVFADDIRGRRHAVRCLFQRRWPALEGGMRRLGVLRRALAWQRDSYALGLGDERGFYAHLQVNRRRIDRIRSMLARSLKGA
ncbi:nucleotidyltransferase family protein [Mesorhizobium marinum]|uniref:nucleotidyltransferase family protein n=1 Tax=Mesorhizobium marinum TaxID=3228790 RepID=UPI003466C40B